MKVILLLIVCLSVTRGQVARGTISFARNLYNALPDKEDNLIFSPLSVHTILSLLYQGATGTTADKLRNALQVPDALHTAEEYKHIVTVLNSKGNVTIELANKMYVKKDYELKETFRQVATEYFSAGAENLDFEQGKEAANTINAWVRSKTHDKIDHLVEESSFDSNTRIVLLNAIYFKGKWQKPFSKMATETDKFYISETETVDCQMMSQSDNFEYADRPDLGAQFLKLPYEDSRFNMIVVLPYNRTGISELQKKLANEDYDSILEQLLMHKVSLSFPKFKIESTIELSSPLSTLGLGEIFEDTAQFPKLVATNGDIRVSNVVQKAFIEVNEEGAEAAAAVGGSVIGHSPIAGFPHVDFRADHQFLYCITTKINNTNVILFEGKLTSPK